VDIVSETGTYGLDEISLSDAFLAGSEKAVFDVCCAGANRRKAKEPLDCTLL
jgi:hypothetical protein